MGIEKNHQHWRARQHAGKRQLEWYVGTRLVDLAFGCFSTYVWNLYFRPHKIFHFQFGELSQIMCGFNFCACFEFCFIMSVLRLCIFPEAPLQWWLSDVTKKSIWSSACLVSLICFPSVYHPCRKSYASLFTANASYFRTLSFPSFHSVLCICRSFASWDQLSKKLVQLLIYNFFWCGQPTMQMLLPLSRILGSFVWLPE